MWKPGSPASCSPCRRTRARRPARDRARGGLVGQRRGRWWTPPVSGAGLDVTVLRLLDAPDVPVPAHGRVAYLATPPPASPRPGVLRPLPPDDPLRLLAEEDHPRRAPWARPGGVEATLRRADTELAAAGLPGIGPARQVKTWNLCERAHPADGGRHGVVQERSGSAGPRGCGLLSALAEPVPAWRRRSSPPAPSRGERRACCCARSWGNRCGRPRRPLLERLVVRWVDAQAAIALRRDARRGGSPRPAAGAAERRPGPGRPARRPRRPVERRGARRARPARAARCPACSASWPRPGSRTPLVHGDLHPGARVGDGGQQCSSTGRQRARLPRVRAEAWCSGSLPRRRPAVVEAWAAAWGSGTAGRDPLRALGARPARRGVTGFPPPSTGDSWTPSSAVSGATTTGSPAAMIRLALGASGDS